MYTCDLDVNKLAVYHSGSPEIGLVSSPIGKKGPPIADTEDLASQSAAIRQRKIEQRESCKNLATDLRKGYLKTYTMLAQDEDFIQMRAIYKKQFFDTWQAAFKHYLKGEWKGAKNLFQSTQVYSSYQEND